MRLYPGSITTYLWICDLQNRLAKVLALKHSNKALRAIFNPVRNICLILECSFVEPLRYVPIPLLNVLWPHVLVSDNETPESDSLRHNIHQVLDAIFFFSSLVV